MILSEKMASYFTMGVTTRKGITEEFKPKQIRNRLEELSSMEPVLFSNPNILEKIYVTICEAIPKRDLKLTTSMIDDISVRVVRDLGKLYPECLVLAARIFMSNLHKQIGTDSITHLTRMMNYHDKEIDAIVPLIHDDHFQRITEHAEFFRSFLNSNNDYNFPIHSMTFMSVQGYLATIDGHLIETPTTMYLRTLLQEFHHLELTEEVKEQIKARYEYLSKGLISPATPILIRSARRGPGGKMPSTVSCVLMTPADSTQGLMYAAYLAGVSSAGGGGVGIDLDFIRANGSRIAGANGYSGGTIPFARIYGAVANGLDQGGSRKGSFAIYASIYHKDILKIIELRTETGSQTDRVHNLFYGVKIPPLFLRRAKNKQNWSMFSPRVASKLANLYGEEFEAEYERLEASNAPRETMAAESLLDLIATSAFLNGMPYIRNRDAAQLFHNHNELNIMSNLCTEVDLPVEPIVSPNEGLVAVCNLETVRPAVCMEYFPDLDDRAIGGPREGPLFNFPELGKLTCPFLYEHEEFFEEVEQMISSHYFICNNGAALNMLNLGMATYSAVLQLNNLIDGMTYPDPAHERHNTAFRPIGVGAQGTHDAMILGSISPGLPGVSAEEFTECTEAVIYYFALLASIDLARRDGPYPRYQSSQFAKGYLQFDLRNNFIHSELEKMAKRNEANPDTPETPRANRTMMHLVPHQPWKRLRWDYLRSLLAEYGIRNSTVRCNPPTESTAKRTGSTEMCEPPRSMVVAQKTDKINQIVIYEPLLEALKSTGKMKRFTMGKLINNRGSAAGLGLHPDLEKLFRNIYEYDHLTLMSLTAIREWYLDMAQSNTWYYPNANTTTWKINLYRGFSYGLKTVSYYTRTIPATSMNFSDSVQAGNDNLDDENCLFCSS